MTVNMVGQGERDAPMDIGIIGLGRMGANMARRLARGGHRVVVYNRTVEKAQALAKEERGVIASDSLEGMARDLTAAVRGLDDGPIRRGHREYARWPHAYPLARGYDHRRWQLPLHGYHQEVDKVKRNGVRFVDVGTSGGVWGLEEGYSMMIGGEKDDGGAPAPYPGDARTGQGQRMGEGRSQRCRPLREDGAQRDRVWPDGGVRGGLRDHEDEGGFRSRPSPDRRDLALRERRALVAPRPHAAALKEDQGPRRRSRAGWPTPGKGDGRLQRR